MSDTDSLKKQLTRKTAKGPLKNGLSSGCTLVNLACSDTATQAYFPGQYYLLVGDSASGKSWQGMTALAEASINKQFDDYKLYYGDEENGALMDTERFFGAKLAKRIEKKAFGYVEDYYDFLDTAFDGPPFIYICDSMDSLRARADEEKRQEEKKARAGGKEASGSYGTAKSKCNSNNMPWVASQLLKTKSILVVISQTRDNIGFGSQFNPKVRSGGNALKFYAHLEFWMSTKEKLKRTVKGKPRQIGMLANVKVKKNRQTGKDRSVEVPIYWSHGIDDLGACISYLVSEKHWKGTENTVIAPEFNFSGKYDTLIENLEEQGRENELRDLVASVWREIDEQCEVKRKGRYG